jgi:hypothetical protein
MGIWLKAQESFIIHPNLASFFQAVEPRPAKQYHILINCWSGTDYIWGVETPTLATCKQIKGIQITIIASKINDPIAYNGR